MSESSRRPEAKKSSCECKVDIRIDSRGDVNIYNCTHGPDGGTRPPAPEPCPPPRTEGACVPLGLGCKPKQSKTHKLEQLRARNRVPSALAASFFQTARRFLRGAAPANSFETAVFPVFQNMKPDIRGILECTVDSYETTPQDLRDAGLEPSLLADPAKPIDTATLTAALIQEIRQRVAETVFGDPNALGAERPGHNRFFDPAGEEIFEAQLQICRVNDLRTASFRPAIALGDRLPAEIQQNCVPVLGPDGTITQNCSVVVGNCPGNVLPDSVCARVLDVANGEAVTLSGINFINTEMKVRLRALVGTSNAEVDAHVFGDLDTPPNEQLPDGTTRLIRDCRVKDLATFVVPDDLPPGIFDVQLAMPNNTGIASLGPTILSNIERINIVPPPTARFQIVAERMRARQETSPASFGSDEVALTFLAATLLPDGSTSSLQRLDKRFDDVDSGENRNINTVVFTHAEPAVGMAMAVIGFEVDSERAFRLQIESFSEAFFDYIKRAWEEFKDELISGAGAAIKEFGVYGAIAVAIAAVLAIAVIAIMARWAPADLIMDDAIGFSVIELAELTNVGAPSPLITTSTSPQGLKIVRTPLEKIALTYREFREYISDDEDSNYEVFLRFNRTV